MTDSPFVLKGESCTLTVDYAYYHVTFCLIQFTVLWIFGRTKDFRIAHAFGIFALVMDYGLNYMNTGTRTISYPFLLRNLDSGPGAGDDPMGPLETFLFFIWFDYSAFGVLLWALAVEEETKRICLKGISATLHHICSNHVDAFALLILPIQFWTAPLLSPHLKIDTRTLVLVRNSSKFAYGCMVVTFPIVLRFIGNLSWKNDVFPIFVSGFGCGLVHHAALFHFGMRQYSDIVSLLITLFTEWPALIMGVAVVRRVIKPLIANHLPFLGLVDGEVKGSVQHQKGTRLFSLTMWISLFYLMYPHVSKINDKDAVSYMIPLIPGQHMQSVGTAFLRLKTCIIPTHVPMLAALESSKLDCWGGGAPNRGGDMLVMASAAKSGAVLSARIVAEV
jgi:hypothetical protein